MVWVVTKYITIMLLIINLLLIDFIHKYLNSFINRRGYFHTRFYDWKFRNSVYSFQMNLASGVDGWINWILRHYYLISPKIICSWSINLMRIIFWNCSSQNSVLTLHLKFSNFRLIITFHIYLFKNYITNIENVTHIKKINSSLIYLGHIFINSQ